MVPLLQLGLAIQVLHPHPPQMLDDLHLFPALLIPLEKVVPLSLHRPLSWYGLMALQVLRPGLISLRLPLLQRRPPPYMSWMAGAPLPDRHRLPPSLLLVRFRHLQSQLLVLQRSRHFLMPERKQ